MGTDLANSCKVMSLHVESLNSSILVLDAGMLTDSSFPALQLIALISAAFDESGDTLESASATTFLLPGRY